MTHNSIPLKTEHFWLYPILIAVICKILSSIFVPYAMFFGCVGLAIVGVLLYKLWKMEGADENVRAEFRKLKLTTQ